MKLVTYLLWAALFACSTIADNSIQTSVVGCNINAISSLEGFNGVFYQFADIATSVYSDPSFYAQGYRTGSVVGTASDITNINFSVPGGERNLFGVNVDTSSFAIEFTGYFKGRFTSLLNQLNIFLSYLQVTNIVIFEMFFVTVS